MIIIKSFGRYTQQLSLLCILLLFFSKAEAQLNLVPNPSFEIYDSCPYFISSTNYNFGINLATPWFQPNTNGNSTDYFNTCDTTAYHFCGIPSNLEGYQTAKTGVGYAGFISGFITLSFPYREYLEIELIDTLTAGNKYCISFYVSHANLSARATDNISAYLSTTMTQGIDYLRLNYVSQINSPIGVVIDDTLNWVQVYGDYIASGGEKFMTIGNFNTDSNTTLAFNNYGTNPYAYYYIDDVSVIDCTNTGMQDNDLSKDLEIYPNPVKNLLTIKMKSSQSGVVIKLTDISGKFLMSKVMKGERDFQLDLSAYPAGMYFLSVEDNRGRITKKVIKAE